jgi:hypothetical protein
MKTWLGPLLILLALVGGCAPGSSAQKAAYPDETPTYQDKGMWHQNPETDAERTNRIWSEGIGR